MKRLPVPILMLISFLLINLLFLVRPGSVSAQSKMEKSIEDDGKQIPPEFGKDTSEILLIPKMRMKKYDKQIEENFKQHYFGKYLIIDGRDMMSGKKYNDLKIYKYAFGVEAASASGPRQRGSAPEIGARFIIMNRLTGQIYKTKKMVFDPYYSDLMIPLIQALEKKRLGKSL